jgi:fibronectin type 3 domain-containing protein/TolB-like protein
MAGCAGQQYRGFYGSKERTLAIESLTFEREIPCKDYKTLVGVASDARGNVFVLDASTHQVHVFDALGNYKRSIGETGFWSKTFPRPSGITADNRGQIYVADDKADSVQVFDANGAFSFKVGKKGSEVGEFRDPQGLTMDTLGNFYVVDSGNKRLQKFDHRGIFVLEIVSGPKDIRDVDLANTRGPISFIAWPAFNLLSDVAVGEEGRIYLLDEGNCVIHAYSPEGAYLFSFGGKSRKTGKFLQPRGISVGEGGVVCVSDGGKENVQLFDPDGRFLRSVGKKGKGTGQFDDVQRLDATANGTIYVADRGNRRIQVFSYGVPEIANAARLEKPVRIAVFDFKNNNPDAENRGYGEAISEMFITAFAKRPNFEVIERKQLKKVLDELYLDQSGIIDEETAKRLGKVLGIDVALAGGVAALGNTIEVDLRLIDVETGKVVVADAIRTSNENELRSLANGEVLTLEKRYAILFGPPLPPEGVEAKGGIRQCALLWNAGTEPDVKQYRVYRSSKKGGPFTAVGTTDKTEWLDENLEDGVAYFYYVAAVDDSGLESARSPLTDIVTESKPPAGALRIKKKSGVKRISLSWKKTSDDVTGYIVYRAVSPNGPYRKVAETRKPLYREGGLGDAETYYFKVANVYKNGIESMPSAPVSANTEAPPAIPRRLRATNTPDGTVALKWTAPPDRDVAKFVVFRSRSEKGPFTQVATVRKRFWGGTGYTDRSVEDGTSYYYKVRAIDKHGLASPLSEIIGVEVTRSQTP